MKLLTFSILLTFFFFSCQSKEPFSQDPFSTLDAEELFFKNVRLSDYLVVENKVAGMNIHTHKRFNSEDELIVKLVQNWRDDKAFLMIVWPDNEGSKTLVSASDTITWSGESMVNHLQTAQFIFNHTQNNEAIYVDVVDAVNLNIPDHFLVTVKDFMKLTSKK